MDVELLEIVLFVTMSVGNTGGDPERWTALRVFPSSNTSSSVTFAFDDAMASPEDAPVIFACERVRLPPPVRLKIVPPLDWMIVVAWLFPTMVMSLSEIVARGEPRLYVVTSPVFGTPGRSISWPTPRAAA
jgi:hypothetical protein